MIQVLLLLKQTILSVDPFLPLAVNGRFINLGSYPEFIYNHDSKKNFKVELALSPEE